MLKEIIVEPLDSFTTQAVAVAPYADYGAIRDKYT